jgi:hypothetical protein
MTNEKSGFGDNAVVTMQSNVKVPEGMGIEGWYHVVCRDAQGNLKWEEEFPNLVVASGKQLMLDTLLKGSAYTVVGPYLGLTNASLTPLQGDVMSTIVPSKEFTAYTVGGSAVRGTAVFASSVNNGVASTSNVVSSTAAAIVYTITGSGGTVYGCFLVTGAGASATQGSTAGTLYSEGNFAVAKATTAGDTVSVTYSTSATS